MKDDGQLNEVAARLMRAVAKEEYTRAGRILEEYRALIDRTVAMASGAEAVGVVEEASELLAWARRIVLAGRAGAATKLARSRKPRKPYGSGRARATGTLSVEG